ncbi:MAG TPA: hypothetical protein VNU02_11410 [Candidatus Dormibacteraeota bacterium]|nr:hypothetical protein [Candidatus Dormibacteraeota bacterium]
MSTRTNWGKIFRVTATAGFVSSAALHLATFTPFPPAYAAAVALVLLAGAFVLLAAMIVRLRESGTPARGRGTVRMVEWRVLLAQIPQGPKHAAVAVIAYVLMNLGLCLLLGDQGAASVRLLSGHLLLFYLIPFMYFRFVEPRLRDGAGPSQP